MHNKILINIGFYLLLLFAFSVTVYAPISYVIAAAIVLIWLLDILIFRESNIINMPLFYPLVGFAIVLTLGWILSNIYGNAFPFIYNAVFPFYYFIVPGFVRSAEQRRMVLWIFMAGATLVAGLQLVFWWTTFSNVAVGVNPLPEPSLFMVSLAFAFLLSYYSESRFFSDKIFWALIALPLALVIMLSADRAAILFVFVIIILVGLFRDRTIFIPVGVALLFLLSGAFGIEYYFEQNIKPAEYKEFISRPITTIRDSPNTVSTSSFYGQIGLSIPKSKAPENDRSYFVNLIEKIGPPAFLLFLWALFERAREAYSKHRRVTANQPRAYHLIALLTIVAIIIMNTYSAVFHYPSVILATWLILGMSEI